MLISLDATPHKTMRLVISDIPAAIHDSKAMEAVIFGLNHLSCWGGFDKYDISKDRQLYRISWEFASEHGPSAQALAQRALQHSFPAQKVQIAE